MTLRGRWPIGDRPRLRQTQVAAAQPGPDAPDRQWAQTLLRRPGQTVGEEPLLDQLLGDDLALGLEATLVEPLAELQLDRVVALPVLLDADDASTRGSGRGR